MNYVLLYLCYRLISLTCLSLFDFLSASGSQFLKNSEPAELAEVFQSLLHRKTSNQAIMLPDHMLQGLSTVITHHPNIHLCLHTLMVISLLM